MKVLFDNNVPAPLRHRLPGHEVDTAEERGWEQLRNGALLGQAEANGYDVMVTGDKNLRYQQNLSGRRISILVLGTIAWPVLRKDTTPVLAALNRAELGSFEALPLPTHAPGRRSGRTDPRP